MLKINNFLLPLSLLILSLLSNCATYTYNLNNYKQTVSFGNEEEPNKQSRHFRIEKKLTWVLFDLYKIEDLNLTEIFQKELPNAKKIYNLKIESEEGLGDSIIRLVTTGLQIWAFVSNRPLASRRTVVITGDVIEE
ncbi:MAG: hypothetical protein H7A23_24240 [Leptospiraceae bacterium]|nr:hypothetical protein [Leptospiraceae bacterium]MCP5497675.1 hypothetical protein [Leptospiraceae bacterium]